METKKLFGFVVAILAALIAVSFVSADTGSLAISFSEIVVNDVSSLEATNLVLSGMPGETIPITVKFKANADLDDLKLEVSIDGYKSDISATTARFSVVNGSTYVKRLSLTLPSVTDLKDDLTQEAKMYVRLDNKEDYKETVFNLNVEKEDYTYDVLSVDVAETANAGDIIALDVVLKNVGAEKLDDSFVVSSIPELGITKKTYFGDLYSQDDTEDSIDNARERRVYLVIPSDVESGDYMIEVKAYNYDTTATVKKVISITGTSATNSTANIDTTKDGEGIPTSILVLTIVLVIIFVVLLVVLIVLLTKKPTDKSEDFGETSYY